MVLNPWVKYDWLFDVVEMLFVFQKAYLFLGSLERIIIFITETLTLGKRILTTTNILY